MAQRSSTDTGQFRAVFNSIACGVVVLRTVRDREGAIECFEYADVNTMAGQMAGQPPEKLVGIRIQPSDTSDGAGFFQTLKRAVETGEPCAGMLPVSPDNQQCIAATFTPMEHGLVATFSGAVQQKPVGTEATGKSPILVNILASVPIILYRLDSSGNLTEMEGAGLRRSGISQDQFKGKSIFEVYPAIRDSIRPAFDGEPVSFLVDVQPGEEPQYYINYCFPDESGGVTGIAVDVTDQKAAEKKLEESQKFIAQIAEASPNLLYVFDVQEKHTVYTNRKITDMLGYESKEIEELGSSALQILLHPDDLPRALHHISRLADQPGNGPFEMEYRIRHADGRWLWVAVRETIFKYDSEGMPWLLMGTAQDITERKRVEEDARATKHFLERVADVTPGLITVFNSRTGDYLYVSRATESMLGYPREPFLEHGMQYFSQFLHPDDLPRVLEQNRRAIEQANTTPEYDDNIVITFEYRVRHANGQWRWLQTCGTIFERAADSTVERIINVSIDITERREAEERLLEVTNELRQFNTQLEETVQKRTEELSITEERFRLLSRATNDVIWDWNLIENTVWWNDNFKALFGYRSEDIEPDSSSWISRIHPGDAERISRSIHTAIDSGATQWNGEYLFRRADGSYAFVFDRGYVLQNEHGEPVRMIGSMLDSTEIRAVQEALHQSEEEYRTLVTATAQIVWSSDAEGRVDDMPAWREITGQTIEEVQGFGWLDAIHPDDRQRTFDTWQASAQTLRIYETEYRLRQRDGSYRYFLVRGVPIPGPDHTVRKWIGTCTDIHERKTIMEALRQSEERFKIASMVTRDAIWDWDLATDTLTYTDNYNVLFGFDNDFASSTIEDWYNAIHPDDAERIMNSIRHTIDSGQQFWEAEYRHKKRDGSYAYVLDRSYIIHNDEGHPVRMVGAMSDITERRISEERLIRSESNLREAQFISHIGNWEYDLANGAITWSEETFHIHGLSPAGREPDIETLMSFFAEPEELFHRIQDAVTRGVPYQFDTSLTTPDGTNKFVQIIGRPQFDATGQCVRMYGTVMDITERKQAEKHLHQSRQQLQLITDALPALITYLDSEQRYQFVNREYKHWFNIADSDQLIGMKIEEFVGSNVYKQVRHHIEKALAGEVVTYQQELPFRNGRRHVRAKYIPDFAEDGAVRGFIALVVDISEEVEAQEQLRIQARVLESMSEGVSLSDADGIILYTNPAEDAIFGYEPGELTGRHVSVQNAYPEEENRAIVQNIIEQLQTKGFWSGEFQNIKKDGTPFITHARITALDMSGRTYWVCVQEDITDEKSAQQALEYQHRINSTITRNATAALFMMDAEGRCTFMNPAAEAMTGYTFEEIHFKSLQHILHRTSTSGNAASPTDHALPLNVELRGYEDVFVRKNGTIYPVMCSASLIIENGVPLATVLEVRDITEEKKAQEAIREKGERLYAALTASETGTFRWNITTDEIDWDDNLDRLFGLPGSTRIQTLANLIDMIHPDDRAAVRRKFKKSADIGTDFDTEFRVVWPDGSVHWLYDKGKVIFDSNGRPSYMTGACVDITARKSAQELVRESAERFRFLADNIPQVIWQAKADGAIEFFNRHWYSYSGLAPETSQGWEWTTAIHPDDLEENIRAWRKAVETGEHFEIEHRIRRSDGVYRWHLGRGRAMRDDQDNIVLWIGSNTDIDDQKQFAEELELRVQERTEQLMRSNEQLNQSNAELERFAYVASHDLQEPLRKITTFGERLAVNYYGTLSERGQWYLDSMRNAATRMQALIDDLLAFSRTTRSDEVFETTDISAILHSIVVDLEVSIEHRKAVVEISDLPVVEAVPGQIRQLFQNLISNALKFNDKEQPYITISCDHIYGKDIEGMGRAFFFDKFCRITVKDNGIGFDEKYLNKIFVIFQRLHNRTEYDGTGIGLAICKKIVEYHRGFITARSTPGEGAEFIICLPVQH